MALGALTSVASWVTGPVTRLARALTPSVLDPTGVSRAWTTEGRAHLTVRGVHLPGSESAAQALAQRLRRLPGVHQVEINAPMGRAVVHFDESTTDVARLLDEVRSAEQDLGLDDQPHTPAEDTHPANPAAALRHAAAVTVNLAGAGLTMAARLLGPRLLPPVVPAAVTVVDTTPRLRGFLEHRLGRHVTDLLLGLGSAVVNTAAQRPIALLTDVCYRYTLLREAQAVERSWVAWEHRLAARPGAWECPPLPVEPRPVPPPPGPVEHVANRAGALALALAGGVLALTRSTQRALGVLISGVPRAAIVGREAFAAQLTTGLARRGFVVLDRRALRMLDRVDTVVLDADLLFTGAEAVRDVVPLREDIDEEELALLTRRAHELVTARTPGRAHRTPSPVEPDGVPAPAPPPEERWHLVPAAEVPGLSTKVPPRSAERDGNERAWALLRGSEPRALVIVAPEPAPLAEELVAAARDVGTVVLAAEVGWVRHWIAVDQVVPGGTRLAGEVRRLQREGRTVAVVSATNRIALAMADLGIGVEQDPPPWGAHLVCDTPAQAYVLLRAVPAARATSRRTSGLAALGCAAGALLSLFGPAATSQDRATLPGALATLLSFATASWWGATEARRPAPRPAPTTPWHLLPASLVLDRLDSSPQGLSDEEAERRVGSSEETEPEPDLVRTSLEELANPLTPALAAGAGASASIGAVADAVMISGVMAVNALLGGAQRLGAQRALRRLVKSTSLPVRLRRSGRPMSGTTDRLVPGDVVELRSGDVVPADCRVLEADGLEVDESSLTGESHLVTKTAEPVVAAAVADRRSMLYQGTAVAAGRALAVVTAVGADTEMQRSSATEERPPSSGVEERLRSLTRTTLPLSVGAGALLMLVDLLRGRPVGQALGRAVSLAVAAVPEGLPFVATVAELAAARRLSRRGALVRNASTIEALGRANVLCFDKTGTLTEGRIFLRQVSDGAEHQPVEALGAWHRAVLGAALRASPHPGEDERLPHPTDQAVVDGAREAGVRPDEDLPGWHRVDELHFEPSRGYHAVLGRFDGGQRLSVKGAPEIVLELCTRWRREHGEIPFDVEARTEVEREVDRLARKGFRVLAVAERPASDRRDLDESRLRGLCLIGLVALADRIRPTAAAAVRQLQQAGVEIVMVTGDHPSTAEAIAAELDVLNGRRVVTGPQLDAMDDDRLAAELPEIAVFARVSPAQKVRVVRALRRAGQVVAVTGDGANDAPAIRLADVGIALGRNATPAAREAADLVVTDDRIETITDAIVEGRAMWASVRDALAILLGGNVGEIVFTVGSGLFGGRDTLNARQLLLVNLLTDALPAMAVAVRPPPRMTSEQLLAEGPDISLGAPLTRDVYLRGALTAGAATLAWLLGKVSGTRGQASTVALVALVAAQLGQTVAMRGRTPLVVISALLSLLVLALIVQVPGVSHFFGCRPLLPHSWAIGLGSATVATLAGLLVH
ncbi:MAG TPA: HAD-IC family P-type ATPase [Pseudonocardiaceae bacterium]